MNKKVLVTAILFGSLTVSGIMSAQSVYPGQHQGKLKKETVALLIVCDHGLIKIGRCSPVAKSFP